MPPLERNRFPGLASGAAIVLAAMAAGFTPRPALSVADWAAAERWVAPESGSPMPGPWSNDVMPPMIEIMECLSPGHPCTTVTLLKSHQISGSETGLNFIGHGIDHDPSPMAIFLPTIDLARDFERAKLAPMIDGTPALRRKVERTQSRDRKGSSTLYKKFAGGLLRVSGANASGGLQIFSYRRVVCEELSEWPETNTRGDPLGQVKKRLTAWSKFRPKAFFLSTPGLAGLCRITDEFLASDQRRYYVRCPQCAWYQALEFKNLKWRRETPPHDAYFVCAAPECGGVIEEDFKDELIAGGRGWVKTYPGDDAPERVIAPEDWERARARPSRGREPGFAIWQAYSPFVGWDQIVRDHLEADGHPYLERVFSQQVLGEAYVETGEVPDWQKLHLLRLDYPLGFIPPGGLVLTGGADVGKRYIDWSVYCWGIGMTGWLVDKDVIECDPANIESWAALAEVINRKYRDSQGNAWPINAFGIDSGYMSNIVYHFCTMGATRHATDGRDSWTHPSVGVMSLMDVNWAGKRRKGGAELWPIGTYSLKSSHMAALRKTVQGPNQDGIWPQGCLHSSKECDKEHFQQLCSEYVHEETINGKLRRKWKQMRDANEELDKAVIARAMAAKLGLERYRLEDWRVVAAERGAPPEQAQLELEAFAVRVPVPAAAKKKDAPRPAPSSWLGDRGRDWFRKG